MKKWTKTPMYFLLYTLQFTFCLRKLKKTNHEISPTIKNGKTNKYISASVVPCFAIRYTVFLNALNSPCLLVIPKQAPPSCKIK